MNSNHASTSFTDLLRARWQRSGSLLCVGLDPDLRRLPQHLGCREDAILTFCKAIVDATHDLACAFKPQIAYFSAARAEGALEDLVRFIHDAYPGVAVVLDAKRGDIGPTAEHYAREAFERYQADAVTLSPYLGFDSIRPFVEYPGKGVLILCRNSNPGAGEIQDLDVRGQRLFEHVAHTVAEKWNASGACGLVVGATCPEELAIVRAIAGPMPILVPGVGAQAADIEAVVRAGATDEGGLLINSSRAILYADDSEDFAAAARRVAIATRDEINRHRATVL